MRRGCARPMPAIISGSASKQIGRNAGHDRLAALVVPLE